MLTHNEDLLLAIARAERSPFAAPLAAIARTLLLDDDVIDAPEDYSATAFAFDPYVV